MALLTFPGLGIAQTGELDPSFSQDGIATPAIVGHVSSLKSVVTDANNRIVAIGKNKAPGQFGSTMYVIRFNESGILDNTFSVDGRFEYGEQYSDGQDIALQSDGTIIAVGTSNITIPTGELMNVVALSSTGVYSPSFINGGSLQLSPGSFASVATCVAIDTEDDIYVGGNIWDHVSDREFVVMKLNSNGTPNINYGTFGAAITGFNGYTAGIEDIAVHQDGKLIAAGWAYANLLTEIAVVRYDDDGVLDPTFGTNGRFLWSDPQRSFSCKSIQIQSDGKYLLAGEIEGAVSHSGFVARLNANGTFDTGFGTNGFIEMDYVNGGIKFANVKVQSDNKILVAGTRDDANNHWAQLVCRFFPSGNLDSDFGINGCAVATVDDRDAAFGLAIDDLNRIILAGESDLNLPSEDIVMVSRFLPGVVGILELSLVEQEVLVYPNPISGPTTLSYSLRRPELLNIALHDTKGSLLTTYLNGTLMPAGDHTQSISMPTDLASGNYLLVFSSPNGKMSIQVTK